MIAENHLISSQFVIAADLDDEDHSIKNHWISFQVVAAADLEDNEDSVDVI